MRKWEKKYEEFKSSETKVKFDELKEKVENKQANQEEIKEYKKMERIYRYLPQVENLKEAINLLNEEMEVLKKENEERVNIARIEKLEKEIEADRKKYLEAKENGNEDFNELVKIQDKELKLNDMKQKVSKNTELSEMSNIELKNEILATKSQISKCHLAARCFMEGYSRESINIKVNKEWKNRKFTSTENLSKRKNIQDKKKDADDKDKTADDKDDLGTTTVIKSGMKSALDAVHKNGKNDSNQKTTALVDQNKIREEIEEAHPWLRRFSKLPLLGKRANKKLEKFVKSELQRIEKISEAEEKYKAKKAEAKAKIESQAFKAKYSLANYDVMDIAEKGVRGLEEDRINSAKLRYEEMKKRAQDPNRYQIDEDGVKHDTMEKISKDDEER